ncbi:hypothetical protein ACFPAG_16465 [Vogesella sp. GCM10023246]|uniref:Phage tail protein n=1 Tax=Vogesella oryzagri TaxID=3160864 RepID=A0ABV1M7M3_9NEIS
MFKATFDPLGFPTGYYRTDFNGNNIPAEAIDLSEQQWEELKNNPGRRRFDHSTLAVVVFDPPAPDLNDIKNTLCKRIDVMADSARLAIAGDPLRVVEYERAAIEAQVFKDAGYIGAVPPAVQSWAEAKGWTGEQAANSILTEAASWNAALYGIREMRLKGKEAVRNAPAAAEAQAAAEGAMEQIHAVANVGNAQ